jgi:hypothetical protein
LENVKVRIDFLLKSFEESTNNFLNNFNYAGLLDKELVGLEIQYKNYEREKKSEIEKSLQAIDATLCGSRDQLLSFIESQVNYIGIVNIYLSAYEYTYFFQQARRNVVR